MQSKLYQRHIWFYQELLKDHYPNAMDIARQFGLCHRTGKNTVQTYRERWKATISFNAEKNGYFLEDKLQPGPGSELTQNEWMALLLAEELLKGETGTVSQEIRSILKKFTKNGTTPLSSLRQRITCCLEKEVVCPDIFTRCLLAILQQRSLTIQYSSPWQAASPFSWKGKISTRSVSPQYLLYENGAWLLIVWCHQKKELRNLRPTRIINLKEEAQTPYHPISISHLYHYTRSGFGAFKGEGKQIAKIKIAPNISCWAYEKKWHPEEIKKKRPDGWLELQLPYVHEEEIMSLILSFKSHAEVMEPLTLRRKITTEIQKMLKTYEGGQ